MENNKIYERIEQYAKEIEEDTSIDIVNLRDKQFSSPQTKHKWLYKMTMEKKRLLELYEKKDQIMVTKNIDNPLQLSRAAMKAKADKDDDVIELNKEIKKQELLVEYLDAAVNKIFSQMGFDFKNLVELIKMEQL